MGRANYRRGIAPIRTADQLADLLPIPVYLLVTGYARAVYPASDRAHPAARVGIMGIKELPDTNPSLKDILPIWVHWTQWKNVVVPVVDDARTTSWTGINRSTGDTLVLAQDVLIPQSGGEVQFPAGTEVGTSAMSTEAPGGLYMSEVSEYLTQLAGIIRSQAVAEGY